MVIRITGVAVPAVIGIGVAIAACGSAPATGTPAGSATLSASSVATVPARATASGAAPRSAGVPAGYRRIGGSAQGVSIAAPASWVEVNLARQTIESAARKLSIRGISTAALVQAMESLQKSRAVIVYNVAAAISSPVHYAPNLSAECTTSGVSESGSAGVAFVKAVMASEFKKVATHVAQTDAVVGGVPGVLTSYQITPSGTGPVYGSQLEVLPKPDKVCFVTLTAAKGQFDASVLRVAARTARFP